MRAPTTVQKSIHSWDDPDISLLDDRRGDLPDFPVDALRSKFLQQWVERAAHGTGTNIDHVAVPLLGICSGLIGTARRVRAALSWSEPMTDWAGVIGYSGDGKTPGLNASRRPLDEVEKARVPEIEEMRRDHEARAARAKVANKAWQEKLKHAKNALTAKPVDADDPGEFIPPRLYVSDATVEKLGVLLQARPGGMMIVMDELAGWFHNMSRYSSGTDNQFWLMAWDGNAHSIERMGRPSVYLDHLLIGRWRHAAG
jgi:hypothetical protein